MNVRAKELLVAALRTGNYKQGRDYLAFVQADGTTCYCPWGIACELYPGELTATHVNVSLARSTGQLVMYGSSSCVPPPEVVAWLFDVDVDELELPRSELSPEANEVWDVVDVVIGQNDSAKLSFAEIADWLERVA